MWKDVIVTHVNQLVTPFGRQVELPGMRPQAFALSPNGRLIVATGKTSELIVISLAQVRSNNESAFRSILGSNLTKTHPLPIS